MREKSMNLKNYARRTAFAFVLGIGSLTLVSATACRTSQPGAADNDNAPEVTATPQPVGAETFVHETGGIQFTAPQGWKSPNTDDDSDDVVTLTSPDEAVEVTFYVSSDDNFEQSQKDIVEELGRYIKNAKIREKETRETTINGLKAISIPGSGTDAEDNKPVEWDLTIIDAKKPVFVVSIASPDKFAPHAAAYETLVQSIKPIAATPEATAKPNAQKK